MEPDFDRWAAEIRKAPAQRRVELLRAIGWTTLRGRGARAERLRAARLDLDDGRGHPFRASGHRPPLPLPHTALLTGLVVVDGFFEHLRRDCPHALLEAHLKDAPEWMWAAYLNAKPILRAGDQRWKTARARLTRELVADRLGLPMRTLQRHERTGWDWVARRH